MIKPESRSHLPPSYSKTSAESLRSEITPEPLYMSRRLFIAGLGAISATAFLAACTPFNRDSTSNTTSPDGDETIPGNSDDITNDLTSYDDIANYNNFYEFSYSKEGIGALAKNFQTSEFPDIPLDRFGRRFS